MSGRRVLVTGLSTFWGGRLAEALESDPEVETIVGVDNRDPTRELERTEFVRVDTSHALIRRIVQAAEIDTVVDTRLVTDSTSTAPKLAHENNVIGTMNILAACGGSDSPVRKFLFKSSARYYGCEQDDPAFFTEDMRRPHPPGTAIERDIVEAEAAVGEFAEKNPSVVVTLLRFPNVLGAEVRTAHTRMLSLPFIPSILGFDPRCQFVHEDDVVGALEHGARCDLPGIFNVAGDGVLVLSEVASLLGKRMLPVLPPYGLRLAVIPLRRAGLWIPPEMINQLRFGRGLDNRKFKATGYQYRYSTKGAIVKLREHLRLSPVLRGVQEPYRYEREVEEFLRWSSSVRRQGGEASTGYGSEKSSESAAPIVETYAYESESQDREHRTTGRPAPITGGHAVPSSEDGPKVDPDAAREREPGDEAPPAPAVESEPGITGEKRREGGNLGRAGSPEGLAGDEGEASRIQPDDTTDIKHGDKKEVSSAAVDCGDRADAGMAQVPRVQGPGLEGHANPESAAKGEDVPTNYDDLSVEEVCEILSSLGLADLESLRDYEGRTQARERVLGAIEAELQRQCEPDQ